MIWSCDTGQQVPCFDRCQLTITWVCNIKDVPAKKKRIAPQSFTLAYMEGWMYSHMVTKTNFLVQMGNHGCQWFSVHAPLGHGALLLTF